MMARVARDPMYRGRRFLPETIELCVRWYITYRLSYRDLVAMMAERGIFVSHTTIMRWVPFELSYPLETFAGGGPATQARAPDADATAGRLHGNLGDRPGAVLERGAVRLLAPPCADLPPGPRSAGVIAARRQRRSTATRKAPGSWQPGQSTARLSMSSRMRQSPRDWRLKTIR